MDTALDQARRFFQDGVAHYQAGRLEQAERQFVAALALAPGRPSVLTNLGAVRLKLGRPADALAVLQEAVEREPGNAEALGHCAAAHAELGHAAEALALFDRALAIDAKRPALWTLRGTLLREMGRTQEAAESFREALARGGDAELNRYYLGALAAGEAPASAPRHYVENLFDAYAAQFDSHLVQALNYRAPELLTAPLAGRRHARALDLGCGTGLAGPALRALAGEVTGVDVSANMLAQARARDVYDTLVQQDVLEFLAGCETPFDLVLAADVFIYVGALEGVFRELARVMPAGASFCFTVEEAAQDLVLRPSLRYAHSEEYVRRLAAENGFVVTRLERRPVREEQRVPIPGLFVWMERRP
ncbi:methyltransferase domain-containing protein [Ramlibacter sp. XY19]|uniref:tetratricopeptide repeat protein n=1 Tax=Ramlibacter paludis TaxID=2908000 RepID=UPI0023DAD464|nr:tetratricopeptide repeat protein [Ramlibacter paludis]MCG2591648.1 methyltransferase domain-containing protein [Ramlibacter paludis]